MRIRKSLLVFIAVTAVALSAFAATWRSVAIINSTINSTTIGATTPSSGIFTTLQANSGVAANGTGIRHLRVGTCTTTTGSTGFCGATITFSGSPFADTNYTIACTLYGTATATLQGLTNKQTTSIDYVINNTNGNTAQVSGTLNCIIMHD